jgi:hypothetical protein
MFGALALVSLAVDMGRVRVAREQLSTAADAAALGGAQKIASIDYASASADAVSIALDNSAIQGAGNATPVVLQPASDVEFGLFRTPSSGPATFTRAGGSIAGHTVFQNEANAIHVTALRTNARGSAVGLFFARAIGLNQVDVKSESIAVARGGHGGYGLVGIDWVHLNGTTMADGYDAASGPYGGSNVHHDTGTVASNGTISLVGTADVWGDGRHGVDILQAYESGIHGWQGPLDEPLVYPPKSVPGGLSMKTWPKKNQQNPVVLAGGATEDTAISYWYNKIDMTGHQDLQINGYVKIYVTGDIDMEGGSLLNDNPALPAKCEIIKVGRGSVDIGGGSAMYAHVYAPEADVTFHGTNSGGFYGWIIGKTLDVKGNSELHYDESLPNPFGPPRAALVIVK